MGKGTTQQDPKDDGSKSSSLLQRAASAIQKRLRLGVFFETVVLLALITGVGHYYGVEDRWIGMSLHPFWAVVLLMSVQYGTGGGLTAAFVATLFLYVGNLPNPNFGETLFDYQTRVTKLPFLWFVVAFALGEIRQRLEHERRAMKSELETLRHDADTVLRAYEGLRDTKEFQDRYIVSQKRTVASIFRSFVHLAATSPGEMLLHLDQVFATALKPKKFSVFATGPNGLEVVTNHGWSEDDSYSRRVTSDTELFHEVVDKRRVVSTINPADEKIIRDQGIIAAPLIDRESDQVFGMVKIEEADFHEFNFNTLEAFNVLCELVGTAYSNARRFRNLERNALFSETADVLSFPAEKALLSRLQTLARHWDVTVAQIELEITSVDDAKLSSIPIQEAVAELAKQQIGDDVWVFRDHRNKMKLRILAFGLDKDKALFHAAAITAQMKSNEQFTGLKIDTKVVPSENVEVAQTVSTPIGV